MARHPMPYNSDNKNNSDIKHGESIDAEHLQLVSLG